MRRTALYARVSSDRQEHEDTIQSQLAELRDRLAKDGVHSCEEFLDEGYSRDDLVRPALDSLRDLVAQDDLEGVYVQSPDRLASGAKLVLLVEEFQKLGVQVIFLKGGVEETPEGKLLIHMQGAIAEYERTKIAERTRRGKLYWARQGAKVGGHAPYGYRFVKRSDNQRAHLEIDEYAATVVRAMYRWLAEECLSLRAIARRLNADGTATPRGARAWRPTTVDRIVRNPVYKGTFYYQRAESVLPARRMSTDPYARARKTGRKTRPLGDWITIPVPSLVDDTLWERAQQQLTANGVFSRRNNHRHRYLLRGLIRCHYCGSTYSGQVQHERRYYRCTKKHTPMSSTEERCVTRSVRADPLEDAVSSAVTDALKRPEALVEEYRERLENASSSDGLETEQKQVSVALRRVQAQEDRITDAYINEAMNLDRYKGEMGKLQERRAQLQRTLREVELRAQQTADGVAALDQLEAFCTKVAEGLDALDFEERQQLLRLLVERVTLMPGRVRIETVIPLGPRPHKLRTRRGEPVEPRAF